LSGIGRVFEELPFDLDIELCEGLDDIEGGVAKAKNDTEVSSNDKKNGKNSKRNGSADDDLDDDSDEPNDDDADDEEDKPTTSEEQKKARMKLALSKVSLYMLFTGDESFDALITNLDDRVCRAITGLPARSIKKILTTQDADTKQKINRGITRFRSMEQADSKSFQEMMESE
jgi:ABC-type Zn2+ transport system substrate-binding protein/surface adhesin